MPKLILLCSLLFGWAGVGWADELPEDRYHFSVSARGQADNDWMVVVLSAQRQDKDLARASTAVNEEMAWALAQLGDDLSVQRSTESYYTQPVYSDKKRQVRAWRVSQSLRLESGDFARLGGLLQTLQQRLALEQMQFSVKPDTRELLVEELMVEALANFRRRAQLIAHQMDAVDFKPISVQIDTGEAPSYYAQPEMMMRGVAAEMAAPAIAGGESEISVRVNAAIELQY